MSTWPATSADRNHQPNLVKSAMDPWRFPQPLPTAILAGVLIFAVLTAILRAVLALF